MTIGNVDSTFIAKLSSANTGGNDLAALKKKLGKLLKLVKDLAQDNSMDPKLKKKTQELLQIQIQMLMQQIAELEREGEKAKTAPADENPRQPTLVSDSRTASAAVASGHTIDTHA